MKDKERVREMRRRKSRRRGEIEGAGEKEGGGHMTTTLHRPGSSRGGVGLERQMEK